MRIVLLSALFAATLCGFATASPVQSQDSATTERNLTENLKKTVEKSQLEWGGVAPNDSGTALEHRRAWILEVPERNRSGNSWVDQSPSIWPFQRAVEPGRPVSPISVW